MMALRNWPYLKDGHRLKWQVTTPPTSEPISLSDQKDHSRVSFNADDILIEDYIATARQFVEAVTGVLLLTQTVEVYFDEFPTTSQEAVELPVAPVQSVTQISYLDASGNSQVWDPSNYKVDLTSFRPRISPAYTVDWPETREEVNAVTITCTAGWATAAAVPANYRMAIKLLAGTWYENREDIIAGIPTTPAPYSVGVLLGINRNTIL